MDAFKISVKLFVEKDDFGHAEFVPLFHRWIQDHVLDDHLASDVTDYAHVPSGPGSHVGESPMQTVSQCSPSPQMVPSSHAVSGTQLMSHQTVHASSGDAPLPSPPAHDS